MALLTIERERFLRELGFRVRVLVDGVDVTRGCFVADDRQGYVGVYPFTANGQRETIIRGGRRIAKAEILEGRVAFVLEPAGVPCSGCAAEGAPCWLHGGSLEASGARA